MAHKYTVQSGYILRDGAPFAYTAAPDNIQEVARFTEAIPQVIEALRESLAAMERMDRALIAMQGDDPTTYPPKGEVVRARAALAAIGAL